MPVLGLVFKTSERRSASLVGSTPTGFRHKLERTAMTIEVLYFEGCPNYEPTLKRVKQTLKDLAMTQKVLEVIITTPKMAQSFRFLGSPTVLVNGLDVEPSARNSDHIGFGCRTYICSGRRVGLPSEDLIRAALIEAQIPAPKGRS